MTANDEDGYTRIATVFEKNTFFASITKNTSVERPAKTENPSVRRTVGQKKKRMEGPVLIIVQRWRSNDEFSGPNFPHFRNRTAKGRITLADDFMVRSVLRLRVRVHCVGRWWYHGYIYIYMVVTRRHCAWGIRSSPGVYVDRVTEKWKRTNARPSRPSLAPLPSSRSGTVSVRLDRGGGGGGTSFVDPAPSCLK